MLNILKKVIGFSPLIGILGHRQVGKTTILEKVSSRYFSLDQRETLLAIQKNPDLFLEENSVSKTALDESQMEPALFPALKERVRKNKKPGQYILSGSVRFTSRTAIRESLTGRIVNLELLPFSIGELHHRSLVPLVQKLNEAKSFTSLHSWILGEIKQKKNLGKEVKSYLERGGLPGLCFMRDSGLLNRKIADQLFTLLDRDIRLIYPTTVPFLQILELVKYLSVHEGEIISYIDAQRTTDLSVATIKKLLSALEGIFLLRLIPSKMGQKGFIALFEDQAESFHLYPEKSQKTQLEFLLYRHIRLEYFYQLEKPFSFFHYSTRGGARVPFAIEVGGHILGFILIDQVSPSRSEMASANSFLKTFNNSKVIFVTDSFEFSILGERTVLLPLCFFL